MRTPTFSWSFLIPIILSISLSVEIYGASGQCPSDQQSLLLQLKNSLVFDTAVSEINLVDWNQSTDCCSWHGVSCHEGRVIGLCLSNKSIIAGIEDSSLFHLQYLKSLDLSFNNFSNTPIPASFGKLTNLRYLNLSNAGFVGQIPIEISRLTNLVTLDISAQWLLQNPQLRLQNPNLSVLVQDLSKLEELYLDGVNISACGSDWGPALSSSLHNLRVLSLSDCSLSGPIDHSLEKLHSLSVIILNGNKLFASVPGFIAKFSNLTSLSLVDCELNGTFPKEIFQVPTLQTIVLVDNKLLQGSFPEFPKNSVLQEVVVSLTNFSGELPTSIGSLRKLSTLDLFESQFNGTLPKSMAKLTQLVYLDLSVNNFTGPIPSFKMSKNLTKIVLSHNGLTGVISSEHLEGLPKLVGLYLGNNLLSGIIPSSLFALPSLEIVDLSDNHFSGRPPEIPNPSFSMLGFLDLSGNKLEGSIPVSIFKLKKLGVLSLAFNELNGTIQLEIIQGLESLSDLDLSYNNLSFSEIGNHSTWSSFPKVYSLNLASCKLRVFPFLKNQPSLFQLDLSNNQIHGMVPNWIWGIGNGFLHHLNLSHNYLVGIEEPYSLPSYLNTLDLHSNQIHGMIPVLPPYAAYIDFSDNNFSSSIPTDICNNLSVSAIFFSFSKNSLTGVIPESICNATNLEVLDVSYNYLSGVIPPCLIERLDFLGVLNLRSNNFSSAIPDAFPAKCSLQTMDLDGNFFEGRVPKSLENCLALEVLDLGHNKLIDKFPCFLMNIFTLRVLVLRSNKFYGSIECSANTNESWEMLQIIDLAHNSFSGQLQARNLANWKAMMATTTIDDAKSNLTHLQFMVLKFSQIYYEDSVTLTSKGLDLKLVKILTIYTCIDFSSNFFNGPIPEEIGELTLLYVLNLSNNAFSGSIPSSFGELRHLESLDLSKNKLKGEIPTSLASLNFLSYLNLSFNQLIGRIPTGNQFQTFSDNSFWGNERLCGSPLAKNCSDGGVETAKDNHSRSGTEIDWNFLSAEIGFIVGFGSVVGSLVFCKRWRESYFESVIDVAFRIFPLAVTRKLLVLEN